MAKGELSRPLQVNGVLQPGKVLPQGVEDNDDSLIGECHSLCLKCHI